MMHFAVFVVQVDSSFWLSLTYQLFSDQFIYSLGGLSELYVIWNAAVIIYRNRK